MGQKERPSKQAESDLHGVWLWLGGERTGAGRGGEERDEILIEMGFIWITELGGVMLAPSRNRSSRLSLFRLALCSISPFLFAFSLTMSFTFPLFSSSRKCPSLRKTPPIA